MRFQVTTLCDFANVREGMLSLLSAGVTRLWRMQFPAEMHTVLALVIELDSSEATIPKEMRVRIEDGDGQLLMEQSAVFQIGEVPANNDPGEPLILPMIMNLRDFKIPRPGRYQIVIDPLEEGIEPVALRFRADYRPDPDS
ncbi:MAG: hypothetical protein F4138_08165 [Acidimicrobiia bacterium]|nr:hypothetical protein [Acidimicrobiia bacterium]